VFAVKGEGGHMELAKFEPMDTTVIPTEVYREGFIVIHNKGDSMEKLIMDGSKVVVDTTSTVIVSGSIYALRIPWEGCILRECYSEPHGLLLRPYNRNCPLTKLNWDEFEPDMVIGKVFCSVINVFR
jgi:phage repressor protein C with HTH and peptisase S24 domain